MKKPIIISGALLIFSTAVFMSCKKDVPGSSSSDKFSPEPVLPVYSDNYEASSNDELATLGRVLFYDKNLSLNNSVACGSCHQQTKGFCDNLQFSPGLENVRTPRNSPSIF